MDSTRILSSEMLITTTVSSDNGVNSLKLPSIDINLKDNFKTLDIYTLIHQISVKHLWLAHQLVNPEHGGIKDTETGNTLLHCLISSIPKLAKHYDSIRLNEDNKISSSWTSAIVGLLYRLVVHGRCSVNAQNHIGNTPLHLVCLLPNTDFLTIHLIRLGADPEIKNNSGLHVYYNCEEQRAWLVKNLPGLNCGIWNAIRREDITKIDYCLSCWCRTVANQPNGKSLFECAMSTGNYELVRHIDQTRNTNELIAATMALDLNYMEMLLSIKIEKEKCQVNKCDMTFDPPRPLIAELKIIYGSKANKAIELLEKHGGCNELQYYEEVEKKKMAFINSPFYLQVQTAKTVSDLNEAWKLIDHYSFQPNLRRHTDQATFLHFLVERYKSLRHQQHLQRGLIRLMAKLAISGVDLQARDSYGNTALLCAAKENHFIEVVTGEVTRHSVHQIHEDRRDERGEKREGVDDEETEEPLNYEEELNQPKKVYESVIDINEEKAVPDTESTINIEDMDHVVENVESYIDSETERSANFRPSTGVSKSEQVKYLTNSHMKIPHFSDQRLISVLIQSGSDSSIPCNDGYSVYHENYIPKGAYTIDRNIQSSLLKCSIKRSKGLIDHPGIWPIVDRLIYSIQYDKSNDIINFFYTELENTIKENLTWLRAKRSGLTVTEWIKSLWVHQDYCDKSIKLIYCKLIDMLQHYISLTDFAIYAMAGDIQQLKQCLAMGKGQLKAQLHIQKFLTGIKKNDVRANFISRPLLISVMEYSTAEVLKLMIQSGANLSEYYSEMEPFGPVAFWSFKEFVSLQHTYEVVKEAPIHLRDSNGSSLFHYAANLFQVIHPQDNNGFQWASLILATVLKRGVKIIIEIGQKLNNTDTEYCETAEKFRPFEEKAPHPFDLHDIINSETGDLLTAEQLVDRQIAFLVSANHIQSIEELNLHGYNYVHLANSGPPKYRYARVIAVQKEYNEMITLLDIFDQYRLEMSEVHKTILIGDYHHFLRLVNNKKVIMSRDWRERSLLHLAVLYQLVNYQDCLGRTPLHYAICLNDNRRLFLKIVAKCGSVDKHIKDLRNISINQYGEYYEKKIPEYIDLIEVEKSNAILEPNWPDQKIYSLTINQSLKTELEEKQNANIQYKDKLMNEQQEKNFNCLTFPIPGAFNAIELKRIKSATNWRQRT
ncbi:unnamed protein product [Heterobilharzia americana]|nr:unnamed protein product [Heterobilharzia americana]